MRKYHLLPANLEYFNMNNLRDELQKNKYLKWFNSKSSGCKIHSYEKGDIVYIYYKNLTDGSNRILFRGEVLDPDFIVDNNTGIKEHWIKIEKMKAISLKDKRKFDYNVIVNKYNMKIYRTPEVICSFFDNDLTNTRVLMVNDLENEFLNNSSTILETFNYFNESKLCECCNNLDIKNWKSRTFIKENGFIYYEVHHLLMQNMIRNKSNLFLDWFDDYLIDLDFNKINLCPVCHR